MVIAWTSAYVEVKGNENADRIGKVATEKEKDSEIRIPFRDLKQEYQEEMRIRTQRRI